MTLSIITVNLNNRDGLQRTINSVVSQTFTDYEWIVIDGGSTDGSRELIEQYSDHFAYWCSEPDKGIYNAMNKGITHAKGEWLYFLNSGDWYYDNNVLKKIFSAEYSTQLLYGNYIKDFGQIKDFVSPPNTLTPSYILQHFLCHQTLFFRRDLNINYDEQYRIAADWALCWSLFLKGIVFQKIPVTVVNYDAKGISALNQEKSKKEIFVAFEKLTPDNIKKDILELYTIHTEWDFINKRRLLRKYLTFFKNSSKKLYEFLIKIDKTKSNLFKHK